MDGHADGPHRRGWRAVLKAVSWAAVAAAVAAGFAGGYLYRWGCAPAGAIEEAAPAGRQGLWTCSMHPQIRQPRPGRCPICNMDLVPVTRAAEGPRTFTASPEAAALMDIQTAPVERKSVAVEVRMVGKVDYDETRLAEITAWLPGRLDRLFVDYTGVPVRKGEHLVELYSPELISAQEELLQAIKAVKELAGSGVGIVRETTEATVTAAREKLRLLGLKAEQIADIERRGKIMTHMTVYAPIGGIVIRKHALEGAYVTTGMRIYTIADLGQVWVKMDAYESDLEWLHYGQDAEFTTVSYPGETFKGMISFIDPVLDARTRTVKVRVNAPNPAGRLKPDMFVSALVKSVHRGGGKVMSPALAGKWVCPMHPAVIKDAAGGCDVCGMALERSESLYAVAGAGERPPLVVPASAVLRTGKRAIVYVQAGPSPTFEGREIVLGPRAGDYYLVVAGLDEGQRVVTRGNFKIDSALQIQAKPSMMTPRGHSHD